MNILDVIKIRRLGWANNIIGMGVEMTPPPKKKKDF